MFCSVHKSTLQDTKPCQPFSQMFYEYVQICAPYIAAQHRPTHHQAIPDKNNPQNELNTPKRFFEKNVERLRAICAKSTKARRRCSRFHGNANQSWRMAWRWQNLLIDKNIVRGVSMYSPTQKRANYKKKNDLVRVVSCVQATNASSKSSDYRL